MYLYKDADSAGMHGIYCNVYRHSIVAHKTLLLNSSIQDKWQVNPGHRTMLTNPGLFWMFQDSWSLFNFLVIIPQAP